MLRSSTRLSSQDYIKILNYYEINIPENKSILKSKAEDILAQKLCRCIKKVGKYSKKMEKRAIAICSKGVFTRKGLKRGRFQCKKKNNVTFKKIVR